VNEYWDYHCGNPSGVFRNLRDFTPPLEARYGTAKSAEDYLQKSQVASYESHRAMFEGYSRNKYTSTGLIQWMQNNPWPEMIWHLYDFYLNPSGSYFGTKKGCEAVHIQYSYDDNSVWIVNSLYQPQYSLNATAEVFSYQSERLYVKSMVASVVNADSPLSMFVIPNVDTPFKIYFVKLTLRDIKGNVISNNLYWLSKQPDVLDWDNASWFRTPCSQYADYTLLQTLPHVDLTYSSKTTISQGKTVTQVKVSNPSDNVAFFIRLRIVKSDGMDVLPIIWTDNYFTLMSLEQIEVNGTYTAQSGSLVVEVFNNISGAGN